MNTPTKTIKLVMPLWQGGNNPAYGFGAALLDWLSPKTDVPTFRLAFVPPSSNRELDVENGITGRRIIMEQLRQAQKTIRKESPDSIVTLGGDCLVSLVPFAHLVSLYGPKLGILWVDAHPDIMTPEHFSHAHAHVLGALMGHGDSELTSFVKDAIPTQNVMIAGVHGLLDHEADFLTEHGIATCSPEQVRHSTEPIKSWIRDQGIEALAIHFDLDVLDPETFRSVLFARPGCGEDEFAGIAQGKLNMGEVVTLIKEASTAAQPVGLSITEHLPWDAINLKSMLEELPLIGPTDQ